MAMRRRNQPEDDADGNGGIDPEFLALTERQRARIDAAFDRGVDKVTTGRKRKRPKSLTRADAGPSKLVKVTTADDLGECGFMDDAEGGFVNEDGGFVDEGDGGFLPDDSPLAPLPTDGSSKPESTLSTPPPDDPRIPLRLIAGLLQSLGLPYDDDVLNVFKASASGWDDDDDPRGRRSGGKEEGGVERKDFRAVCAALMAGDEDDDQLPLEADMDMGDGEGATPGNLNDGGGGFLGGEEPLSDNEDEDEDAYFDDSSSMSSLSSDSEFGASRPRRAAAGKGKGKARARGNESSDDGVARRKRKTKKDVLRETGPIKLTGRQREVVQDIWDMLRPPSATGGKNRSAHILGRDEVKTWARSLGEMWTDEEITEMVTLFSSQHEQRGLSFDDFGAIMVRAGLA